MAYQDQCRSPGLYAFAFLYAYFCAGRFSDSFTLNHKEHAVLVLFFIIVLSVSAEICFALGMNGRI